MAATTATALGGARSTARLATRTLRSHALALGHRFGLLQSVVYDLSTGAVIVWTLTAVALVAAPLLARWRVPVAEGGQSPAESAS